MTTPSLQQERTAILKEMAQIDCMIRGHLSEQSFKGTRKGETVTHGPYHLLQRHEQGKNNCRRVGPDELSSISNAVLGHQRFQELSARYAALTEQMTWDKQPADIKKKFRRFWRHVAPKSPPS